jgi:DNA repair protein RecO (recombination protein O)
MTMNQSAKIVTSGLVLRETETKEADKILTVLTSDLGKIALVARGARRRNSRIAAASQLLAYSELTLYKRGGWYILDEASTIELFAGVRQDFVLLSLASYFAELTDSLTEVGEDTHEVLPLVLNALYALGTLKKDPAQVKAAFELRVERDAGTETFYHCRWLSIRREMDRSGLRRIRKGISMLREVE